MLCLHRRLTYSLTFTSVTATADPFSFNSTDCNCVCVCVCAATAVTVPAAAAAAAVAAAVASPTGTASSTLKYKHKDSYTNTTAAKTKATPQKQILHTYSHISLKHLTAFQMRLWLWLCTTSCAVSSQHILSYTSLSTNCTSLSDTGRPSKCFSKGKHKCTGTTWPSSNDFPKNSPTNLYQLLLLLTDTAVSFADANTPVSYTYTHTHTITRVCCNRWSCCICSRDKRCERCCIWWRAVFVCEAVLPLWQWTIPAQHLLHPSLAHSQS